MRQGLRLRLTLSYGSLMLVAGLAIVSASYALTRASLSSRGATFVQGPGAPDPDQVILSNGETLRQWADRIVAAQRDETLDLLLRRSFLALAAVAIASVVIGRLVADQVLRPLHDITSTARRLSGENLAERIRLTGPEDELKELADTFDAMLDRLDRAFEAQRRFVANASHELRTPLSVIRAEADLALTDPAATPEQLRAMAETVREATERADALIEGLLALARSQRSPGEWEPVDLAVAAEDAVDAVRREVAGRGLRVDLDLGPAVAAGDRSLLDRLVANLVENAVRHNAPGGGVLVRTYTRDGLAAVRVDNDGDPIDPEAVATLFEPFRRLGRDRTGSDRGAGLGLSIVRAVAAAHGGRVSALPRPQGGLSVLAELPVAAAGSPPPAAEPPGP